MASNNSSQRRQGTSAIEIIPHIPNFVNNKLQSVKKNANYSEIPNGWRFYIFQRELDIKRKSQSRERL